MNAVCSGSRRSPSRCYFRGARLAGAALGVLLLIQAGGLTRAADNTFVVNSALDDGSPGTLRWAIGQANAAGAGTQTISIQLAGGQTIALGSNLPMLDNATGTIAIENAGQQMVAVDGQASHRVFFVATGEVSISNVAIVNGAAQGGTGGVGWGGGGGGLGAGGALFVNNGANVTIHNVQFDGNQATGGAGGAVTNSFPAGGGGGGFGGAGGNSINGGGGGGGYAGTGGAGSFSGGGGGGGIAAAGGEGSTGGGGGGGDTVGGAANSSIGGAGNAGATGGAAGDNAGFATPATNGGAGQSPALQGAGGGGGGGYSFSGPGAAGNGGAGGNGGVGGGGGGGGGGGFGSTPSAFGYGGTGGQGGAYGGGGGGGLGHSGSTGGQGGDFGGGGGAGRDLTSQYATTGGAGGFGGGGGGAADSVNGNVAGAGGFGGGDGGARDGSGQGHAGGGGGDGLGGAIFVRQGGTLTVIGATTANSSVVAGAGGSGSGALDGASGNSAGQDLYLMDHVNVTFDQAGSSFSGSISGTGGVTVQGQGTTVFSGANNYTGGTTVDGTARLQGDTTSLQGAITNNANVTFDQSFDGTYAGNLSGTGALYLTGPGSVTLSNTNNLDSTYVQAGRLAVDGALNSDVVVSAGATLGGVGVVTGSVVVNGNAAPGNSIGTLTVSGPYTQNANSTLTIEVNNGGTTPGVNNDLIVADSATLNGGTVVVAADPGTYSDNTTYRFLRSNTALQGSFAGITDPWQDFRAVLGYDFFNGYYWAYFTLGPPSPDYVQYALTPNEFAVAEYLDATYDNPDAAYQDVLDGLNTLTGDPAAMQAAFNAMSDQVSPTMATVALQNTTLVTQQLAGQLRSGSAMTGGNYTAAAARSASPSQPPVVLVSYEQSNREPRLAFISQDYDDAWQGWSFGYGLGGDAQSDGNAAGLSYGMGGMLIGVERYYDSAGRVGFFGGYQGTSLRLSGLAQQGQIHGGSFGGYLHNDDGFNYYSAIAGTQFNGYDTTRYVQFDGISETAEGGFSGWQGYGYLERGVSFRGAHAVLQPYGAVQYVYLRQNGYTETGAGALNLNVGGIDANSLRSLVGGRVQLHRGWYGGRLTPEVRALWLHEFLDTNAVVNSSFASIGGGSFAIEGLDLGRDWAILGGGLRYELASGWQLYGNYDAQVNAQQVFHLGSGGVQYSW